MKAGSFFITLALSFFSITAVAQTLKVNVLDFTNANDQDEYRVNKAVKLLQKVVNHSNFRSKVLNMNYRSWGKTYKGFSQTNMTREQVLASVLAAKEILEGGSTGVIDLRMDMYQEVSNVVGYTSPDDPFFHMNRYIQQHYSPAETAGNIFHEWLHKIGHGHSFYSNRFRPHSVPYKLGSIVSEMAAELEAKGDPIRKSLILKSFQSADCSH